MKILEVIQSDVQEGVNEAYLLQLENTPDQLVLHIKDTKTGERTEVRGKPNYEIDYDADDELHRLLDVIGKASNISELMNGAVVNVNPKHPDGPKSYRAVAKAMDNAVDEAQVDEGVNDPAIFKAIFLAGGPGSGKTYVTKNIGLNAMGLKLINSDVAFEKFMANAQLPTDAETIMSPQGQEIRDRAKSITKRKTALHMQNRLGLVLDGTGKDYAKITNQANALRTIGYDVAMVFVNTDLETALERNTKRKRSLPQDDVKRMWSEVQENIGKFQNFFGRYMYIIDNSDKSNSAGGINSMYKRIRQFIEQPPQNKIARDWIKSARQSK